MHLYPPISHAVVFIFSSSPDYRALHSFLHDALPIFGGSLIQAAQVYRDTGAATIDAIATHGVDGGGAGDWKSTRLNSSHTVISYAVFCLKKKTSNILETYSTSIISA